MKQTRFGRMAAAVTLLLLLPCLILGSAALEESEIFYANDTSNVLSEDTEFYICDENYRLYDQCRGAEVVVVTVDFLDGRNAEEYAYDVFNDWGLGDADENNGVLILLCPGEEKYWLMAGDGLRDDLSAGVLQNIAAQYTEAAFDTDDYDKAALDTFKAVVAQLDEKYGNSQSDIDEYYNGGYIYEGEDSNVDTDTLGLLAAGGLLGGLAFGWRIIMWILLILLVLWLIRSFTSIGRRRTYGPTVTPMPRRRSFWDTRRPPPPPRPTNRPSTGGGFFGGLFGGSSSGGRRSSGGGFSRGGGFGSSSSRSSRSSSRSSFGSSSRSSSRSSSSRSSSRSSSSGRRSSGGGRSRGGGSGRR